MEFYGVLCKQGVNELWKQEDPCVKPYQHTNWEKLSCFMNVLCFCHYFYQTRKNICYVVEEGYHSTCLPGVEHETSQEKVQSDDVVQTHLDEVVLSCPQEVGQHACRVVAGGDQVVLAQLRRVLCVRKLVETLSKLASAP